MQRSVLVAAGEPMLARGLIAACEANEDIGLVAAARDHLALLAAVAEWRPDAVIVDLALLVSQEEAVLGCLSGASIRVLLFGGEVSTSKLARMLRSGAHGYLDREADEQDLAVALAAVWAGRLALGEPVQDAVTRELLLVAGGSEPALTGREREVLALVELGLPTSGIGRRLFMSEATVKTHLRRASGKLETRGRSATVAKALRLGLI